MPYIRQLTFILCLAFLISSCTQKSERQFLQKTVDYLSEGKNLWALSIYSTNYQEDSLPPKTNRARLHNFQAQKRRFLKVSQVLQREFRHLGLHGKKLEVDSIETALGYPEYCLARRFSFEFDQKTFWLHVVFQPSGNSFLLHSIYWAAETQQAFITPLRKRLKHLNRGANSLFEQETIRWRSHMKGISISCYQTWDTIKFNCSSENEVRTAAVAIPSIRKKASSLAMILPFNGDCTFENALPILHLQISDSILMAAFALEKESGIAVLGIKALQKEDQMILQVSKPFVTGYGFVPIDISSAHMLVHQPHSEQDDSIQTFWVEDYQLEPQSMAFVKVNEKELKVPQNEREAIQITLMQFFCRELWQ